jgi:hypothetical protein
MAFPIARIQLRVARDYVFAAVQSHTVLNDLIFSGNGGWWLRTRSESRVIALRQHENAILLDRIGAINTGPVLVLDEIHAAMHLLWLIAPPAECYLTWAASSLVIPGTEVNVLLARWAESGEPPVLSIIDLELERRIDGGFEHRTIGLRPFADQEICARFGSVRESESAARILARLARHALSHGPISPGFRFFTPDRQLLTLEWNPSDNDNQTMVTIIL